MEEPINFMVDHILSTKFIVTADTAAGFPDEENIYPLIPEGSIFTVAAVKFENDPDNPKYINCVALCNFEHYPLEKCGMLISEEYPMSLHFLLERCDEVEPDQIH